MNILQTLMPTFYIETITPEKVLYLNCITTLLFNSREYIALRFNDIASAKGILIQYFCYFF